MTPFIDAGPKPSTDLTADGARGALKRRIRSKLAERVDFSRLRESTSDAVRREFRPVIEQLFETENQLQSPNDREQLVEELLDEVIKLVRPPIDWQSLAPRAGGALDLVDDILLRCHERRVRLTWQQGTVTEQPLDGKPATSFAVKIRNSVFRAVMARLAALSDPADSGSVSPYGGRVEFSYEPLPGSRFLVDFVNTPSEQRLEVTPICSPEKT